MMTAVRRSLAAVALFTLAGAAWLTLMTFVLRHPGSDAIPLTLLLGQSAVTLWALWPEAGAGSSAPIRGFMVVGAGWLVYWGAMVVATQVGRPAFGAASSGSPHFEGYAVVVGLALVCQGILTIFAFVPARVQARP
jgi:hypothetical protein